jgi:hypothetical protein
MVLTVYLLRAKEQFGQGPIVDSPDILDPKVVA